MTHRNQDTIASFIRRLDTSGKRRSIEIGRGSYRPLVAAWLIETVLAFGLYKKNSRNRLPELFAPNSEFMKATGFAFPANSLVYDDEALFDETAKTKLSNGQIVALLKAKSEQWGRRRLPKNLPLMKNVQILGQHLGLSNAEMSTLFFAVFLDADNPFDDCLGNWNPRFNTRAVAQFVARLTGYNESEILNAIHPDSILTRIGLLSIDNSPRHLEHKFDLMHGLSTTMTLGYRRGSDLLSRFMVPVNSGELQLNDFEHLSHDIEAITLYLRNAVQNKVAGVNILFYGEPGTGKTELAKTIASSLELALFEVTYKADNDSVMEGSERLRAFSFCQRILETQKNVLLMFDEIEDVFSSGSQLLQLFGLGVADRTGKAWINRVMETNPVPSIWITNNPGIDPAYLRRFDYSVRFPKPPKSVRLRMARHHLKSLSSDERWLDQMASHEEISPAQFKTAAKVARIAARTPEQRRLLATRTLSRSMRLLGQTHQIQKAAITTGYSLSFINADRDIYQLTSGLKRLESGSLCFYGPPGTGKSELGRHIADSLGKPLLIKRASDLLSKWVGETEKHLSSMFDEAREQDAVLLLDEADSFLRDRRGANAQWEITQVNELLTQMEAFTGVFICTTNLMGNLDQASLRRFSFKVKLDYLRPEQCQRLFVQEFVRLGGREEEAHRVMSEVSQLNRVTPGDFAVVARQICFREKFPTAKEFIQLILDECRPRMDGGRIGFVRS